MVEFHGVSCIFPKLLCAFSRLRATGDQKRNRKIRLKAAESDQLDVEPSKHPAAAAVKSCFICVCQTSTASLTSHPHLLIFFIFFFLRQRSVWSRWRSAAPSCRATFRVWCSAATNAPSPAPVTRRCSCTCRSTPRSNRTSASSATTTAAGAAS